MGLDVGTEGRNVKGTAEAGTRSLEQLSRWRQGELEKLAVAVPH